MAEKNEDPFPSLFDRDPVQAVLGVIEAFASGFQGEKSIAISDFGQERKDRLLETKTKFDTSREALATALAAIKASKSITDPKARQEFLDSVIKNSPKAIGELIKKGQIGKTAGQFAIAETEIVTKIAGMGLQFALGRVGSEDEGAVAAAGEQLSQFGPTEILAVSEKLSDQNRNKFTPDQVEIFSMPERQRSIMNAVAGTSEGRTTEEQRAAGLAEAKRGREKIDVAIIGEDRVASFLENGEVTQVNLGKAPKTKQSRVEELTELTAIIEGRPDAVAKGSPRFKIRNDPELAGAALANIVKTSGGVLSRILGEGREVSATDVTSVVGRFNLDTDIAGEVTDAVNLTLEGKLKREGFTEFARSLTTSSGKKLSPQQIKQATNAYREALRKARKRR